MSILFHREHELVSRVAAVHAELWPAASAVRLVRAERGYGRGVADLVVLDFDEARLERRRRLGILPVTGPLEAEILANVRARAPVRLEELGSALPDTSPRHLRIVVGRLVDAGHLVQSADGKIRSVTGPLLRRAVAVEAKLTDWRGGLIQASRYRSFANRCYLALSEPAAIRLMAQPTMLEGLGVGVISVGDRVRILAGTPDRPPSDAGIRCWAEEAESAELLGERRRLVRPFPGRFTSPSPDQLVARAT